MRRSDRVAQVLLVGLLVMMIVGYVRAQTQMVDLTTLNTAVAITDEKIKSIAQRVDSVETTLRYAMVAMFGQLLAHIMQIQRASRGRG